MLDIELSGRKPGERPHEKVVGTAVVDSEVVGKVVQKEKAVAGVKALLVLPVAALLLAVVAGNVGTNELVADTQVIGSGFKQGGRSRLLLEKQAVNSNSSSEHIPPGCPGGHTS